jgi:two-component system sensor histidine kinase PilS (NtrC family)
LPSLRDRLKGLMAFRVAAVTLFLGGMIAVGNADGSNFSSPNNLALLALIVVTYGLTIVYALLLKRWERLSSLARLQLGADAATTSLLVLLTHGLDSIFIFLFYINIISAAVVAGRRLAVALAAGISVFMVGLGLAASTGLSHPIFRFQGGPRLVQPLYFEVAVNCAAAFMVAFLAGDLSERLGRTQTQLKRRQLDLETLRTLTRNIVASLDSGLLTIDRDGSIIFFNRAASQITGIASEEVVGASLEEVFPEIAGALETSPPPPDDSGDWPSVSSIRPSGPRLECEWSRPDGETIFLGFSVSNLRDDSGTPIGRIVVFQDLTEVKRLEVEKKRSERMAAVGELAASIAHEIRNPLASISGSVEMLQNVADLDDNADHLMEIVLREVDRLDMLISEFLDYSRPSSLHLEAVDLRDLVEEVLTLFEEGESELDVDLERSLDDEVDWEASVDQESVRQMLWNLLNNAADVLSELDEPRIRVALERTRTDDDVWYALSVEDNGPGVDPEDEERIFEPFYTTRDDGSGLGLATTHRLVEAHGGRIQLDDSEHLGGARFTLHLPADPDPKRTEGAVDEATTETREQRAVSGGASTSPRSTTSTETSP